MKARRDSGLTARIIGFAAVILIVTSIPYVAGARSEREIEQAISQLLLERHPNDTPDWWRGLGPEAPRVIVRMLESAEDVYQRVRLVAALGNFPEDRRAVEYLRQQAEATPDEVVREKAIRAMGNSQGVKELDFIAKFLAHPDAQTRLAAAQAIQGMRDPVADARLEEHLKTEKAPFISQRIRRERPVTKPLVPVATNADRVNPEFAGTWKGVLAYPTAGSEGMITRAVALEISIEGATQLGATLVIPPGQGVPAERRVRLNDATGTRSLLVAKVPVTALAPMLKAAGPIAVTGELEEQAGYQVLQIALPSHAATMIVRKAR